MNAAQRYRQALEEKIGSVPTHIWDELLADGYLDDMNGASADAPEQIWRDFVETAQRYLRIYRGREPKSGVAERVQPGEGTKSETGGLTSNSFSFSPRTMAMMNAMTAHSALEAARMPEVVAFREEVLGDSLLSEAHANEFVTSYATRLLTLEQFRAWEIPVVGHTAKILDHAFGDTFSYVDDRKTLRVDPPGIIRTVRYAYPKQGDKNTRCMVQRGAVIPVITNLPLENYGDHWSPAWLWPGSLVDRLYELANHVARVFEWPHGGIGSPREAARFVLTGDAPNVRTFVGGWQSVGQRRIQLIVPPWVPAEEVAARYRALQSEVSASRMLPKKTKPLDIARFVWERERLKGSSAPRPWTAYLTEWNKLYPERRVESASHFRTYFLRGEAAVVELNYG